MDDYFGYWTWSRSGQYFFFCGIWYLLPYGTKMTYYVDYLTVEESFFRLLPKAKIVEPNDVAVEEYKKPPKDLTSYGATISFVTRRNKWQVLRWYYSKEGKKITKYVGYALSRKEAEELAEPYKKKK